MGEWALGEEIWEEVTERNVLAERVPLVEEKAVFEEAGRCGSGEKALECS